MSTQRNGPAPAATDNNDALLSALLASEVPSRNGQIQHAALRSTQQQQQIALKGFRLRTWVDRALHVAERALVLAAVAALAYWLIDGYGRDWLYELRRTHVAQGAAADATPNPPISLPTRPAQASAPLPFTGPDDALPPAAGSASPRDAFLDPQALQAAPELGDPRPRRLVMPAIGAEMEVYEVFVIGNEWEVAEYAAGFHNGTALPGNVGNSVLSGHAGLRGAVFKDIGRLRPGDDLIVETDRWRYVYRVRGSMNVWPDQIEVMAPTPTPVLTLITCTNWDTQRLIVVADLVDARPLS